MIEVRSLRKTYGEVVAVENLDLWAAPGQILALLGPNGAGKTTTIRCLVGLTEPDAGSIAIAGHDLRKDPAGARRATSYLAEVTRVHDALTPLEYLRLKGRLFDLTESVITARVERLLAGFGLLDRWHEPMAGFSKGMVQKCALAAALLVEPQVLVLDEPLTGLDVDATLVFKEVLRGFAAAGGTVLYSSHLLDVVQTLADVVAVIDRGRLLAQGTLDELRSHSGGDAASRLDEVFRVLTQSADPAIRAREILAASRATGPVT